MRAGALPGPASLARRPPGDGAGVLDHRGERCGGLRCHAGSSSALRRPAARPASWLASAAGWRDGSPGWRLLGPQCGIPMLGGGLQPALPGAAGLQLALQQWRRPAAAPRAQPGSSKRAQPPPPARGAASGRCSGVQCQRIRHLEGSWMPGCCSSATLLPACRLPLQILTRCVLAASPPCRSSLANMAVGKVRAGTATHGSHSRCLEQRRSRRSRLMPECSQHAWPCCAAAHLANSQLPAAMHHFISTCAEQASVQGQEGWQEEDVSVQTRPLAWLSNCRGKRCMRLSAVLAHPASLLFPVPALHHAALRSLYLFCSVDPFSKKDWCAPAEEAAFAVGT